MSEKNRFKPWLKESWCIPPRADAGFVCAMEDVLEVYHRRFKDNEVLVCLNRRIPSQEILREETCAWESQRNRDAIQAQWRFNTRDARTKLHRLYPSDFMVD